MSSHNNKSSLQALQGWAPNPPTTGEYYNSPAHHIAVSSTTTRDRPIELSVIPHSHPHLNVLQLSIPLLLEGKHGWLVV